MSWRARDRVCPGPALPEGAVAADTASVAGPRGTDRRVARAFRRACADHAGRASVLAWEAVRRGANRLRGWPASMTSTAAARVRAASRRLGRQISADDHIIRVLCLHHTRSCRSPSPHLRSSSPHPPPVIPSFAPVIPAKAGTHVRPVTWIPASAGITVVGPRFRGDGGARFRGDDGCVAPLPCTRAARSAIEIRPRRFWRSASASSRKSSSTCDTALWIAHPRREREIHREEEPFAEGGDVGEGDPRGIALERPPAAGSGGGAAPGRPRGARQGCGGSRPGWCSRSARALRRSWARHAPRRGVRARGERRRDGGWISCN